MVNNFSAVDQKMMKQALTEAKKAFDKGEVPVGAILTLNNQIIAKAHNLMETKSDPTAHAEIICIRQGAEWFADWRLLDTTLYTTLEPCAMCSGAILLARISRVVWAAPDLRHGAHGSWMNLFNYKHPTHQLNIVGGLYETKAAELMRVFFKKQREKHDTDNRRTF